MDVIGVGIHNKNVVDLSFAHKDTNILNNIFVFSELLDLGVLLAEHMTDYVVKVGNQCCYLLSKSSWEPRKDN